MARVVRRLHALRELAEPALNPSGRRVLGLVGVRGSRRAGPRGTPSAARLGHWVRLLALAFVTTICALAVGHGQALAATTPADAVDLVASLDPSPAYWDRSLPPIADHEAFEVDVADVDFDDDDLHEGRSWSKATQLDLLVALIRASACHARAPAERAEAERDPSRFAASRGQPRGPPSSGA